MQVLHSSTNVLCTVVLKFVEVRNIFPTSRIQWVHTLQNNDTCSIYKMHLVIHLASYNISNFLNVLCTVVRATILDVVLHQSRKFMLFAQMECLFSEQCFSPVPTYVWTRSSAEDDWPSCNYGAVPSRTRNKEEYSQAQLPALTMVITSVQAGESNTSVSFTQEILQKVYC